MSPTSSNFAKFGWGIQNIKHLEISSLFYFVVSLLRQPEKKPCNKILADVNTFPHRALIILIIPCISVTDEFYSYDSYGW